MYSVICWACTQTCNSACANLQGWFQCRGKKAFTAIWVRAATSACSGKICRVVDLVPHVVALGFACLVKAILHLGTKWSWCRQQASLRAVHSRVYHGCACRWDGVHDLAYRYSWWQDSVQSCDHVKDQYPSGLNTTSAAAVSMRV